MTQEVVTIENKTGIHARPASIFVQTATKFKSKVQIQAKGKTVDAKSILMIMSMGLVKGTEITIVADGPDEADAVKALKDLVDSKFGEIEGRHPPIAPYLYVDDDTFLEEDAPVPASTAARHSRGPPVGRTPGDRRA